MAEKKLEVKDLVINFQTDNGILKAVRNISFDLYEGETLCIVGESGSGKSVTSKAIIGILAANAIVENGTIMYEGENLLEVSEEEFHRIRGHKIGMIFQDPLSSLNPIVRIGKQITEAMLINSDKLKIMYDEIIAPELVAYKNAIAKRNINIKKEENDYRKKYSALSEEYKNTLDLEKKNAIKKNMLEAKATFKNNVSKIKEDTASKLPALKQALNEKKKFAKEKVKTFKNEENKKFNDYKEDWKVRYAKASSEPDRALLEKLEKEKDKFVEDYNEKLKSVQDSYNKRITEAKNNNEHAIVFNLTRELDTFLREHKDSYKEYMLQYALNYKNAQAGAEKLALKKEYETEKENHISKLKITKAEAKRRALEVMREVGIPLPEKRFKQYPFEFSGGMRQRIVIAIALTAAPEILICDEPTTALDVTIQAQILELIKKIQKERNISCIFITHDLGVVANMADRVAVMYAGKIVEYGLVDEIFFEPKHPYTWALLSSIPDVDSKERLDPIPGTPPTMIYPPKGDAFALRSKYAMNIDFEKEPPFFKVSDTHYAATWLLHPNAPKVEMPKIVSERIKNALSGTVPNSIKGGSSNE